MKNGKKETRHLNNPHNVATTLCGRPVEKVLVWAKKNPPKADDATVCGRCQKLRAIQVEKIEKKHEEIREATKAMASEAIKGAAKIVRSAGKRQPALLILGDRMPKDLIVSFKGQDFTAAVLGDGRIHLNNLGETFNSPSRAGKAVAGREVDGWTFWSYLKADGTREKLDALRKAVA
jgi:hypothetical protein